MIKVIIIKSKFRLYVYKDNVLIRNYPVAIGKPSTPTPVGNAKIINRAPNPGGPYGAMWLGLSIPHIGIHGTNAPFSIGKTVSHGCIRMQNKDVLELARLAPIGTPVTITP
ncbi:L,D-transpeptidase [Clostridium cylindrosporum]|uniref:Putative L,D-transpeptidase YkuD n=1 Tax=Clostridium cylindrosporum DSM 605 TaxID=1121307 RepID=A0A0J8D8G3_CLOCY|nr:L,D-transpeptidase [Clostridium cylindrosporum]KMT22167.1 putative L,D-transpeptidase YkuD [Clostridium cylindrosporum DSM 605]